MAEMTKEELKRRTKQFALRVIRCAEALPNTVAGKIIANQLVRCGTSVGANYRAVLRARSTADFVNKLGVVLEEADETAFWLELIIEAHLLPEKQVAELLKEANELTAIFASSHKTTKVHARISNHKS